MKKPGTCFSFSVILAFCIILCHHFLFAQTKKTTLPDSSKRSAQKIQPGEKPAKLELPDVIIYGSDRATRISGDKLNKPDEEIKLIAPKINYQPLSTDLQLQNHKGHFQAQPRKIHSRTMLQLDAGRYQQLDLEANRWKEAEKYNYSLQGKYERSNGQFNNSHYAQALIKGQVGFRLSPSFIISSQAEVRLFDYGLYGALDDKLKRETRGAKAKFDARWFISATQAANFSVYFQQNNFSDDNGENYHSKFITRDFGITSHYQTRFRSIPVFVRGLFERQKLNHVSADTINTQKYFQVKSWSSFKVTNYFIIKPGILFENFDLSDSFAASQFSPDIEIIATPTKNFGILLSGTRNYHPIHLPQLIEMNLFNSHQLRFMPTKKELELKFSAEYNPTSTVSITGAVFRQNWKNYAFWSRQPETGLFQLSSLQKVTRTVVNFMGRFNLSPAFKFDAGVQMNFDSGENDSLVTFNNHLPYLERIKFPFHLEYEINKTTNASVSFLWIGPRYVALNTDEKLSKFGLLSLYVAKQFHKNIAVFIEGNNLFNQDYEMWQNYPAMGLYFGMGLKGNW